MRRCGVRFGVRFLDDLTGVLGGIDERAVCPDQPRRSLSAETTFEQDRRLTELDGTLEDLAARA